MSTLLVALIEDQTQTRQGLTALIDGTQGYRCAGAWRTCEEMLARLPAARPDVLLLDIGLPGMSGVDGHGFDVASRSGQGEGLETMRRRAERLGGRLSIESSAEGTVVRFAGSCQLPR